MPFLFVLQQQVVRLGPDFRHVAMDFLCPVSLGYGTVFFWGKGRLDLKFMPGC